MDNELIFKYEKKKKNNKLVELFNSVGWKTAEYPNRLYTAIKNSGYVMSAWNKDDLVESVPVNRWAKNAIYSTLPGILSGLLMQ